MKNSLLLILVSLFLAPIAMAGHGIGLEEDEDEFKIARMNEIAPKE